MRLGLDNAAGDAWGGTVSRLILWAERVADADLVAMSTAGADLDAYTLPGTLADAYAGTYDSDWIKAWDGGHSSTDIGSQEPALRHILAADVAYRYWRSEEHTSELQSLMRLSYPVFCLQNKNPPN